MIRFKTHDGKLISVDIVKLEKQIRQIHHTSGNMLETIGELKAIAQTGVYQADKGDEGK